MKFHIFEQTLINNPTHNKNCIFWYVCYYQKLMTFIYQKGLRNYGPKFNSLNFVKWNTKMDYTKTKRTPWILLFFFFFTSSNLHILGPCHHLWHIHTYSYISIYIYISLLFLKFASSKISINTSWLHTHWKQPPSLALLHKKTNSS